MAKYRKKPIIVDAEQFTDRDNPPRGVIRQMGMAGETFFVITIQNQPVLVALGEWIMAEADGEHFYPCADSVFRNTYEPV